MGGESGEEVLEVGRREFQDAYRSLLLRGQGQRNVECLLELGTCRSLLDSLGSLRD